MDQVLADDALQVCLRARRARRPAERLVAADDGEVEQRGKLGRALRVARQTLEFVLEQAHPRLIVTLKEKVTDYAELSSLLITGGYPIKLFREEEVNLESAFMLLTKGLGVRT